MKKLLIVTVIILIAALAGWITYDSTPGKASFTIETEKMRDDAEGVIEKGKDLGEDLLDGTSDPHPPSTVEEPSPTT
jgi:hypothetical protein